MSLREAKLDSIKIRFNRRFMMAAAANEVPVASEDPGKKAQQLCFKFRGEKKREENILGR